MSTFDDKMNLEKPASGDTSWFDAINDNLDSIAEGICPARIFHVAENFTDALMPAGIQSATVRTLFPTIQEAITAADDARNYTNDDEGAIVLIAPGLYDEKLDIPGNITLANWAGAIGGHYGSGWVRIRGDGTLNPTITVTPPVSQSARVSLVGLSIENSFAVDRTGSGQISDATPYALYFTKQATYGATNNWLRMVDCHVRMQTWGIENYWGAGVRLDGWLSANLWNCQLSAYDYSGGTANAAGVKKLLYAYGDNAGGKNCQVMVRGTYFDQQSDAPAAGDAVTFYAENRAQVVAMHSGWNQVAADPSFEDGGTGSNYLAGIDSATAVDNYRNIEGAALVQN